MCIGLQKRLDGPAQNQWFDRRKSELQMEKNTEKCDKNHILLALYWFHAPLSKPDTEKLKIWGKIERKKPLMKYIVFQNAQ